MKHLFALFAGALLVFAVSSPASARCMCTKIYKPVCAKKGNAVKTYGNACLARCARARVCAQGKCRCPVFRLAKPRPGCKYIWRWKGCCKYPKLICKQVKPYCTKLRCKKCNPRCMRAKKVCLRRAKRFSMRDVAKVRRMCKNAGYRTRNRCLCGWAFRKAAAHIILRGMRGCLRAKCKKFRCCKAGRKLCIPHRPNVRCVRAPCCRKLICAPHRCR